MRFFVSQSRSSWDPWALAELGYPRQLGSSSDLRGLLPVVFSLAKCQKSDAFSRMGGHRTMARSEGRRITRWQTQGVVQLGQAVSAAVIRSNAHSRAVGLCTRWTRRRSVRSRVGSLDIALCNLSLQRECTRNSLRRGSNRRCQLGGSRGTPWRRKRGEIRTRCPRLVSIARARKRTGTPRGLPTWDTWHNRNLRSCLFPPGSGNRNPQSTASAARRVPHGRGQLLVLAQSDECLTPVHLRTPMVVKKVNVGNRPVLCEQ